ncbi:CAP domain-containing protein [Geodermatophilus normandii]
MIRGRRPLAAVALGVLLPLSSSCVVVGSTPAPSTGAGPSGTATAVPADEATAVEQDMAQAVFHRVNAEREARGLPPLSWDDDLAAVARGWNTVMAERDRLGHQDLGSLLGQEPLGDLEGLGENVFQATGPVPAGTVHAGWMRSDDHRVNVLQPGWDRLGIAVLCADDGSVWATQEFGRTAGAGLPAVASETPPPEPLVRPEDDGPRCG